MWPEPTSWTCSAPVSSANARPRSNGWQLSRSPWTTRTGQRTRAADRLDLLAVRGDRLGVIHHQELGGSVEPVGDGVLDLLRRMRLGEHLAEEELEEAALVGADVVTVLLLPALGRVALLVEGLVRGHAPRVARDEMRDAPGRARRGRARAPGARRRSGPRARRRRRRCRRARPPRSRWRPSPPGSRTRTSRPATGPRDQGCRSARSRDRHRRRRDGGGRGSAPAPSRCGSG